MKLTQVGCWDESGCRIYMQLSLYFTTLVKITSTWRRKRKPTKEPAQEKSKATKQLHELKQRTIYTHKLTEGENKRQVGLINQTMLLWQQMRSGNMGNKDNTNIDLTETNCSSCFIATLCLFSSPANCSFSRGSLLGCFLNRSEWGMH